MKAKTILTGLDELDPPSVLEERAPLAHEHLRRFEANPGNSELRHKAIAEAREVALEADFLERRIGELVDGPDEETVADAAWRLLKTAADEVRQGRDGMPIDAALAEALRLERSRDGERADLRRLLALRDTPIAQSSTVELVRHRDRVLEAAAEALERLRAVSASAGA